MVSSNNGGKPEKAPEFNGDNNSLVEYESSLQRLGGDVDLFKEFVQIFFEDSPKILEKLFAAVDADDHAEVAKTGHALKGLMLSFGAEPCCKLALEFETAGKNKQTESMIIQKAPMRELYELLCDELRLLIKD